MALLTRSIPAGRLVGTIYDMEEAGDMVAMHSHVESNAHITVVARGSIKAHGNGWERILNAGAVIDFPANQPHELIALEPNTRIVNIQKQQ